MFSWTDDSAMWQYRHGSELTDAKTWSAYLYLQARLEGKNQDEANASQH